MATLTRFRLVLPANTKRGVQARVKPIPRNPGTVPTVTVLDAPAVNPYPNELDLDDSTLNVREVGRVELSLVWKEPAGNQEYQHGAVLQDACGRDLVSVTVRDLLHVPGALGTTEHFTANVTYEVENPVSAIPPTISFTVSGVVLLAIDVHDRVTPQPPGHSRGRRSERRANASQGPKKPRARERKSK